MGHLSRMCWQPGGGAEGQGPSQNGGRGGGGRTDASFPGVDGAAMRSPPRANEPHERTLPNGTDVKWCGLCGAWGSHYWANHLAEEESKDDGPPVGEGHVAVNDAIPSTEEPQPSGALARLHAAGLI